MADTPQELIKVKQGNTLRLSFLFRDPLTKEPRSMLDKTVSITLRTPAGQRLSGAQINPITPATGAFEAYAPPTATRDWPEGALNVTIDVLDDAAGDVTSSQTFSILIERR